MPAFTPPKNPDFPIDIQHKPRTLKQEMGDGVVVRVKDGINHDLIILELVWSNLSLTEANSIYDFLKARQGTETFTWQPPDPTFTASKTFACDVFGRRRESANTYSITATFEEDPL